VGVRSLIIGAICSRVQNFKVNRRVRRQERFIKRNIQATAARCHRQRGREHSTSGPPAGTGRDNLSTIDNAASGIPRPSSDRSRRCRIQSYYRINDVDVDRYVVDGQVQRA
jgi:uncharacterized membrane protein (UPF0182 family)